MMPPGTWAALAMMVAAALVGWLVRRAGGRARRAAGSGVRREPRRVVCAPRGWHERALVELARALAAGRREDVALTLASSLEDILNHTVRGAGELLLLSAEAPGAHGPLLDDELARVVQGATCPVAIYFRREPQDLRRVLVPVHGSPDDDAAVALASRIQAVTGCGIRLVCGARRRSRDPAAHARGLLATVGAIGAVDLVAGSIEGPAERALACARDHDLVIVGAGRKGHAGAGTLGVFRERLVRRCPVPVLLVVPGGAAERAVVARIHGGVHRAS